MRPSAHFLLVIQSETPAHVGWVFPPHLTLSGTPYTDKRPEICLLGDSKACQIDGQDELHARTTAFWC